MLNIGDLVSHDNRTCTSDCMCFFCFPPQNKKMIGIVTTIWIDEDDHQASIIEFPVGEAVFREGSYKKLNILSNL